MRALLGLSENNGHLGFFSDDGKQALMRLQASKRDTSLTLYDGNGDTRVGAAVDQEGARVGVHNEAGDMAGIGEDKMADGIGVMIADAARVPRLGLGLMENGTALLINDGGGGGSPLGTRDLPRELSRESAGYHPRRHRLELRGRRGAGLGEVGGCVRGQRDAAPTHPQRGGRG